MYFVPVTWGYIDKQQFWFLPSRNCRQMLPYRLRSRCIVFHACPLHRATCVAILDSSMVETFRAISHSSFLSLIKTERWNLSLIIAHQTCERCCQGSVFSQVRWSWADPTFQHKVQDEMDLEENAGTKIIRVKKNYLAE